MNSSSMASSPAPEWEALMRLPTLERARKGILREVADGDRWVGNEVDVRRLGAREKKVLLERILSKVEQDNEQFLWSIRNRYERPACSVGLKLHKHEVRFEDLCVEGDVYVGSRALPTLLNATMNVFEGIAESIGLCPSKKKVHRKLHCVSGIVKPGRMTLLLGPPGSGKTTLLKSLAGVPDKKLRMSGRITYCGCELSEFTPQIISSYISQHDIHYSQMTVRETMDFSCRCFGVGSSYKLLLELLKREKEAGITPDSDLDAFMKAIALEGQKTSLITDYILKVLGLEICADTVLGDEMRRGVSGGQKKRVTTGEILVGPSRTLFMDEISTGLDSSTTFQMVKFMKQMAHAMDATVVISLLQPAPEVFSLFDDIILLSEGHIVYHGPREHVLEFFEFMGFKCPERKGIADFLQEVTSKRDQEKYWSNESQQFQHISSPEFASSFKTFHTGQHILDNSSLHREEEHRNQHCPLANKKYGLSSWELFKACSSREWLLMKRHVLVYIFKTVQITIMSILSMSVFFSTEMNHKTIADGGKYANALFFSLVNMMFNGIAEMSITTDRLPVFYKQRDSMSYPAWAFGLPFIILKLPLSLLESAIWIAVTYYPIGFAPAASRFSRQFLALFCAHNMSLSLFRFIAAAGKTIVKANIFGNIFFLVAFVLGGFVISKDDIQPWWIWSTWISPMMYAQNAMAVSEFLDPRWSTHNNDTNFVEPTIGKAILSSRGMFTEDHWYWISIGALVGFSFLFNGAFILALSCMTPPANFQPVIADDNADNKTTNDAMSNGNQSFNMAKNNTTSATINSGHMQNRGMVLPFQPISLSFCHVNYYVDMPSEMKSQGAKESRLQLLCDVSGAFRPGVLTALVGVSGAGKTTLMDVLAGRKTRGCIEGSINLSGHPKKQASFARVSGYCEQNDIHSPHVTVHESLIFSAWLRLAPDIKQETRKMFVEEVMDLVELGTLRNALVGSPGVDGLSTEQRKRLTIAIELVSNPSIIFMDEPTSGLDARYAAIVMRAVRNTVDTGRTVLCTIHQPSIDIFESFDQAFLMKRGGRVIYAGPLGPRSCNLINYFEAIPGVPRIQEGYNPATLALEISSPQMEAQLNIDFGQIYSSSVLSKTNMELVKELSIPSPDSKDLSFPTKYAQSFPVQSIACFWKQLKSYWKHPDYNAIRFFQTFSYGILFGTIFWNKGGQIRKQQDLLNVLGGIYCCAFFLGTGIAGGVQPILATERIVFYRERAAGMYSSFSYAFAQVSIEVVYIAMQSLLYCLLLFPMFGFGWQADKFFWFLYFTFMCSVYLSLFGMMVAALSPNHPIASIILFFFIGFWNLFSGFSIPKSMTPLWWRWFFWVCPIFWTIYGLVVSQVGDLETMVEIPGQSSETLKVLLKEMFGYEQSFLPYVAVLHLLFVLVFFVVFVCAIRFLNYQSR